MELIDNYVEPIYALCALYGSPWKNISLINKNNTAY